MRPMGMLRRIAPWLASAALHAALGGVAFLAVATMAVSDPPKETDAVYSVSIRPGGEPQIGETFDVDPRSYGVPQDTVTIDDGPLMGVPELPLASRTQAAPSDKPGSGTPPRTYERGPVVKFSPQGGGGGAPAPTGPAKGGSGAGEGRDEGVEAVPIETPSPVYPDTARRGNVQGTVIAEIRIDSQGKVESARAAQGSGSPLLDDAALAAVKSWRYKPATLGGKPIPSVRRVRFVFRLE
jgi:protein TonB